MDEIRDIVSKLEKMLVKVSVDDDETYCNISDAIELLNNIKFQDHDGNKF